MSKHFKEIREQHSNQLIYKVSEAARVLGRSRIWLWEQTTKHDLFKSSNGKQGSQSMYHRDHLDIIALHLVDPEVFDADMALRAWVSKRNNRVRDAVREISKKEA